MPSALIEGHSLDAFDEIQPQAVEDAHDGDYAARDQSWNAFDRFELHGLQLNKKPEQHKAALVLENEPGPDSAASGRRTISA